MAAPTFDSSTLDAASTDSPSWNHTIGGGSERMLLVCINSFDAFGGGNVTGVTYNGVNMTKAAGIQQAVSAVLRSEIWYMLEADLPAAGAYSVAATFTGSFTDSRCGSISLAGASQAAPESTATASQGSSAGSWSGNISSIADEAMMVDCVCGGNAATVTPTASQTERWDGNTANMGSSAFTFVKTPAGAKNLQGNFTGTVGGWTHAMVSIAPGGGGPAAPEPNAVMFGANS